MEQKSKEMFLKETLEKLESYHVEDLKIMNNFITCILDGRTCTYTWESPLYQLVSSSFSMPSFFLCYSIKSQGVHSFHIEFTLHKRYRLTIDFLSTSICFSFSLKKDPTRYVTVPFTVLGKQSIFLSLIHLVERYFLSHPSYRIRLTSGALSFSYSNEIVKLIQK